MRVTSAGSFAPHATLPSESQKAATPRAMFPQIFGKYVLEREIGAGGMARVYLATLRGAGGFEKRLVLKQIRAELASDQAFVRRFVDEAKTAVELSHSNIVPVYELGVEQGVYYIAMEFCSGVTLSEMLAATGALEPFEGAYVGVEICRALDYAHRRAGIVHRDVTPRNVLIDDEGAVRLIDFGIAAPVSTGDERGPREIFGSPGHMPPEQLAGARLSPATDVFAVAVLLFEAWTLEPPFRRRTAEESARALEEPPPVLAERVPELAPLSPLLLASLARDPAARPKSADDLARPLREFLKPADLGDLARKLGERVQKTRARAAADVSSPEEPAGDAPATPVALEHTPRLAASVTRTFAARDEWTAWSRQIETRPSQRPAAGPDPGPDTRRLSDPKSLAPEAPGATRPRARRFAAGGLFALGLGAVAAFGLAPERSAPPPNSPPEARAPAPRNQEVSRAPAEPTPSATGPASSAPAPPLPSSAPPPRGSSAPRPKTQVAASAAVSAAASLASVEAATLRLTADPPAEVTVDGEGVTKTLTTPVRALSLKPGTYRVTFRNATYGPPVATRVTLQSGHAQVVHADFREAEPRVTVR